MEGRSLQRPPFLRPNLSLFECKIKTGVQRVDHFLLQREKVSIQDLASHSKRNSAMTSRKVNRARSRA